MLLFRQMEEAYWDQIAHFVAEADFKLAFDLNAGTQHESTENNSNQLHSCHCHRAQHAAREEGRECMELQQC